MSRPMRTKSVADKNHPPKKHKSGTSGHAAPSFNRHKFTSLEREERYNTILQWAFVPERRVDLQRNEYPNFLTRLDALKWGAIASPHDKFDPDVVREFYANAYPPEEGGGLFEHKSWVRGKVIRYDRNYLNMMLNNPYEARDGHLDGYHSMVESLAPSLMDLLLMKLCSNYVFRGELSLPTLMVVPRGFIENI
ncbi:hypothetical protein Lal_00011213 [Lupinus albus]|nr:hypothetical protein Lal_00011213 [Lupinus albus]